MDSSFIEQAVDNMSIEDIEDLLDLLAEVDENE